MIIYNVLRSADRKILRGNWSRSENESSVSCRILRLKENLSGAFLIRGVDRIDCDNLTSEMRDTWSSIASPFPRINIVEYAPEKTSWTKQKKNNTLALKWKKELFLSTLSTSIVEVQASGIHDLLSCQDHEFLPRDLKFRGTLHWKRRTSTLPGGESRSSCWWYRLCRLRQYVRSIEGYMIFYRIEISASRETLRATDTWTECEANGFFRTEGTERFLLIFKEADCDSAIGASRDTWYFTVLSFLSLDIS